MLVALSLSGAAFAGDRDVRVGVGGVAESWQDADIGSVYRMGALFGTAGLTVQVAGPVSAGVDLAFRSLTPLSGESPTLQLLPVTVRAEVGGRLATDVTGFASLGPALVPFAERGADDTVVGTRLAVDARAGARWDPGLFEPPLPPSPSVVQAVEFELWLGRRQQRPGLDGLDLSAWRGGFLMVARL
jgi:hypothetical protein